MADAQAREIGHQRLGIGEGEALVELQPQGGARDHGRRLAMILARACTAGASNRSFAAGARRRRQLGCSSIGARQVGLFGEPQQILERRQHQRRRRLRDIAERGIDGGGRLLDRRRRARGGPGAGESAPQPACDRAGAPPLRPPRRSPARGASGCPRRSTSRPPSADRAWSSWRPHRGASATAS